MTQKFENLEVWKKAKDLTVKIYSLTNNYPAKENFGIISQTTRAALSISCNIAEGSSRPSKKDFCHFLTIAIGSAFELESLIMIAFELRYLSSESYKQIIDEIIIIEKMINGLKRSLINDIPANC